MEEQKYPNITLTEWVKIRDAALSKIKLLQISKSHASDAGSEETKSYDEEINRWQQLHDKVDAHVQQKLQS